MISKAFYFSTFHAKNLKMIMLLAENMYLKYLSNIKCRKNFTAMWGNCAVELQLEGST